jgi:hypothetical protein
VDKALFGVGVSGKRRREGLEYDCALKLGLLGFVDLAHSASAEALEDLEVGNSLANHG